MRPTRRSVVQAAAVAPVLSLLPGFSATATAESRAVSGGIDIDGAGLSGISLSWIGTGHDAVARVTVLRDGSWSEPVEVSADHGHGPADEAGREHGDPVLRPGATTYRIERVANVSVRDLQVHEIAADPAPLSLASAIPSTFSPLPGLDIIERSNWTTRERRDTIDCVLRSSVFGLGCRSDVGLRHGVIHHTVNDNAYTADEVPELLRGIQRFHMDTRGWDDIAYNFMIDRFGRIWHTRAGDPYEPITGGHTTGLNAESVGVAVLGTFIDVDPGQPVVDALAMLLGWKCSIHGIDPLGSVSVRSNGGDFADYGDMVELRTISGHRDNQGTSCPGTALYDRIDEIRAEAAELVPLFGHLTPAFFADRVDIEGWAVHRFTPTAPVEIDIVVDGEPWAPVFANIPLDSVLQAYPAAGRDHGFAASVPITLDTRSITVTARALDGPTTSLMDLVLFATFIDVEPDRWFAPGIYFLKEKGLTTGKQPGLFEPMDHMTRAEMATFLWRFMGEPDGAVPNPFHDVAPDMWFTPAIDWLAESGITTGTSPTTFDPDDRVTRGQMATFLWRLCGRQPAAATTPFADIPAGTYFAEPVRWMHALSITTGTSATTFSPDGAVTRGEIATFLHRLALEPAAWTLTTPPPALQT